MKKTTTPTFARLLATAFLSLAVLLTAHAQTSSVGTIEGRVQNVTSGSYLNNARVTIDGTNRETFTNEYGEYRFTNVPAGPVTLRVVFTGLEQQSTAVTVPAGQSVEQNFALSSALVGPGGEVVQLDSFVVASQRETNAAAIAANEQRFAPNIKNVVSADAFGDVTEGNVGEFLKHLPGVSVDYVAADVRTISVRGFADTFTGVSVDGARMASASSGASSRAFELEQVSINNVSRIEVTKVPTPSQPADSLGGSVNMISKSAFERDRAQFRYRAYLSANHEDLELFKRTPGPGNKNTYKVLPGFDFDYTLPVNRDFGIVVTGLSSNQFNEQHRSQFNWQYSGTGTGATPANPYFRQYTLQDGPKNSFRDSISVKADWRPARNHVLSVGYQFNYYKSFFGNRNININAGNNGTPTPASGTPLTYTPTSTSGATGRGAVTIGSAFRDKLGATSAANLNWRFNDGTWELDAGANFSASRTWYRAGERGHFSGMNVTIPHVSRVVFDGVTQPRPAVIRVLDAAGNEIDYTNINNYRLNNVTVNPLDARDEFRGFQANAKRSLNLAFPAAVKAGIAVRQQERDIRRFQGTWNYVGPNGILETGTAMGDNSAAPFLDAKYAGEDSHFGFPAVQWPSPFSMWNIFETSPNQFVRTDAQERQAYINSVGGTGSQVAGSEFLQETVSAAYVQGEARLLNSRLTLVTGVRFERTEDEGRGPLVDNDAPFVRNADGSFARNSAGARIRKPEAGAAGSAAEARLTHTARGYFAERSYDGYYPSFHATYNITDNFLARFAYAKTLGRPDFSNIIPNTSISENEAAELDPAANPGTIDIRNIGLRPWTADNWDISLEYYTPRGGTFTGGVFQKDVKDFHGAITKVATAADLAELGLDSRYVGWQLSTAMNVGDARISGFEVSVRQTLDFVPGWGRHFTLFANGTKLRLEGPNTASFERFIPESANWGFTFSRSPIVFMAKWNYRGEQQRGAQSAVGPGAFEYYDSRTNLDLNFEYQFSRRFTFFVNARNVFNEPQTLVRYGPQTPGYARHFQDEEFGIQLATGLKGTF